MQVQRVQNSNYNNTKQSYNKNQPSFGILKINKESWWHTRPDVLHEFVANKKVQEFVTIMHNKGVDVIASLEHRPVPKPYRIELTVEYPTDETFKRTRSVYDMSSDKINMFSAEDALANYKKYIEEPKLRHIKLDSKYKEEMQMVRNFNKSLEPSQTENTNELAETAAKSEQKKWWQFWR